MRNCRRRRTNLSMVWIDYRRAFDMIPHSCIIECLKIYGAADNFHQHSTTVGHLYNTLRKHHRGFLTIFCTIFIILTASSINILHLIIWYLSLFINIYRLVMTSFSPSFGVVRKIERGELSLYVQAKPQYPGKPF